MTVQHTLSTRWQELLGCALLEPAEYFISKTDVSAILGRVKNINHFSIIIFKEMPKKEIHIFYSVLRANIFIRNYGELLMWCYNTSVIRNMILYTKVAIVYVKAHMDYECYCCVYFLF